MWIDVSGVLDHALLDDTRTPASPTTNYWPMLLVAQTLGFSRGDPGVSVANAQSELPTTRATIHAARAGNGQLGILVVNNADTLLVEIALPNRGCSAATARRIDEATTRANAGPVANPVSCRDGKLALEMPSLSAVGVVLD